MTLTNLTQNKLIADQVCLAQSFMQKTIGLIGTKSMSANSGLWIKSCNWIHTFFMSMPIDVVYVDKNLTVKKIDHNLMPWRLPMPVLGAKSVFEFSAGTAKLHSIKVGDQLHVGH